LKEDQMRLFKKWLLALTVVVTLGYCSELFADVVCRASKIRGFDSEYTLAKRVIDKATTSDIKSCEVFITKQGDYLYYHSNFVSEDAEFPTKIATKSVRDLEVIVQNLFGLTEESSEAEIDRVSEAHKQHVKFYIDQSLFDASGQIALEMKGAENLYVVFDGTPPPRRLIRLNPIRGPPYVAQYESSLFVKVTQTAAPQQLFTRLQERPFNSREIRFVSLIPDSATEAAIKASGVAKFREVINAPSKETFEDLFRKNTGKVFIVLGHVEGENFVATDVTGKSTLFTLSLAEVERMAETAKCDVVMLGCSSALAGTPVGVKKPFNPVDAVSRLDKALKADTYLDFVRTLSNEDIGLVFDESAFDRTTKRVEADVYAREPSESEQIVRARNLAGRVGIVLGIVASGGSGFSGGNNSGDDDKRNDGRGVSGGSSGSGAATSKSPATPGPANRAADPVDGGSFTLIVIVLIVMAFLLAWVYSRSRTA
jgi:hypothetical protein